MQVKRTMVARLAVLALTAIWLSGMGQASQVAVEKDDFYQAVNQKTLASKQIAPTEVSWSWFQEQSLKNTKELEKEVRQIAKQEKIYKKGMPEQKIADL